MKKAIFITLCGSVLFTVFLTIQYCAQPRQKPSYLNVTPYKDNYKAINYPLDIWTNASLIRMQNNKVRVLKKKRRVSSRTESFDNPATFTVANVQLANHRPHYPYRHKNTSVNSWKHQKTYLKTETDYPAVFYSLASTQKTNTLNGSNNSNNNSSSNSKSMAARSYTSYRISKEAPPDNGNSGSGGTAPPPDNLTNPQGGIFPPPDNPNDPPGGNFPPPDNELPLSNGLSILICLIMSYTLWLTRRNKKTG